MSSVRQSRGRVFTFSEDGFAVSGPLQRRRAYPWSAVVELGCDIGTLIAVDERHGSVRTRLFWTVRFGVDGAPAAVLRMVAPPVQTWARDFHRYGVREDGADSAEQAMFSWLADQVAAVQLPGALAAVRAGGRVRFGPLEAGPDGLGEAGGEPVLPWRRFHSAYYRAPLGTSPPRALPGQAVVEAYRDDSRDAVEVLDERPATDVPNLHTLALLAEHLGGG